MAQGFAALMIDFENVFYYLKNHVFTDGRDITTVVVEMIRSLNGSLKDLGESVISMDAYADFDRISENAQSELYLLGVETHNVLGTDTKNAADMRLCIDTLDIFYNRQEIRSFIFVAGDRDYIPVIQYLKKRGCVVRVVGFPKGTSGDLLAIVGKDHFINAAEFVPAGQPPIQEKAAEAASPIQVPKQPLPATQALAWRPPANELATDLVRYEPAAVGIAHKYFHGKPEIWLVPYLHKLRAEMAELTEAERKRLISNLEQKGAFRVEKRKGDLNDYSVIVLNWNHPLIRDSYPGV
jgi:uncharacterized LabA/DUF88 family protein